MKAQNLVVLYGCGGLSDVGRHAILAALERSDVGTVKVITRHPDLIKKETNWNCGCEKPHIFSELDPTKERLDVVTVNGSWGDTDLSEHFRGASAVVSCLGNRQPLVGDWSSYEGNKAVISAMKKNNIKRSVVISSVGIEEDWPPMEFFTPGKIILSGMFYSISAIAFRDLTAMERMYRAENSGKDDDKDDGIDFLFVRPAGLGEDVVPVGKWYLQKEKYKDVVGPSIAKLDVARFMVQEALEPTIHKQGVVIGGDPEESDAKE